MHRNRAHDRRIVRCLKGAHSEAQGEDSRNIAEKCGLGLKSAHGEAAGHDDQVPDQSDPERAKSVRHPAGQERADPLAYGHDHEEEAHYLSGVFLNVFQEEGKEEHGSAEQNKDRESQNDA